MKNNNFDDIIKSKLQELEQMPSVSDWDVFEEKYDEELAGNEAAFDRSIAEKVENYNIAFNSSHWVLMKEKLEREEYIRTSIYFSKIAEAGIVFLLLFTFLNLFPGFQYQTTQKSFASVQEFNPEMGQSEMAALNVDQVINIASTNNVNRTEKLQSAISNESRSYISIDAIARNEEVITRLISDNDHADFYSNKRQSLDIPEVASNIIPLKNDKMEIYRVINLNHDKPKSSGDSYLSIAFSPTVNIVNSPANYILKTNPYTVDALGFESGIGYSFRKNRFEIGTGVTYAKKSYRPQILNQHTGAFSKGYSARTLQKISFDLISVPFNLAYHMLSGDDFSLYVSAGSSFNIITNAGYRVQQNGQILESLDRIQETRRAEEREYTQGIFQGGSIHDNLFISLDISIGLETKLSENLNFFFAPILRQHIGIAGIGPNQDHVHSLGLNLGIKKKM